MANIIDYVKEYGHHIFHEKTFNPVDSLVLSQLAYIKFGGIVPGIQEHHPYISLKEISDKFVSSEMFQSVLDSKNNENLFVAAAASQRYGGMKLNFYVNDIDETEEKQFAAVTFFMEDGTAFVAIRGTDESIVGWKEDFNMAFMSPVPSQVQGVGYMNMVAKNTTCGLRIGGHSKGGNVSVYAAMKCEPEHRERIIDIYSHDGPGFRNEIFTDPDYLVIRDRIHKYLPKSAIVGMFLQSQEEYSVIESNTIGLLQHDPFSWQIVNCDFIYRSELDRNAILVNRAVNEWLNDIDHDNRKKFVEAFYHVIQSTDINTLFDLTKRQRKTSISFLKALNTVDPETKRFVLKTVRALFAIAAKDSRELRMQRIQDGIKKVASIFNRKKAH
jgi:hypothetical protein